MVTRAKIPNLFALKGGFIPAIVDSGSNASITYHRNLLHNYVKFPDSPADPNSQIDTCLGNAGHIPGQGRLILKFGKELIPILTYLMEQTFLTILSEEDLLEAGIKYFIDYKAKPRSKYLTYKNNRIQPLVNDKLTSIPYKFFKLNSSLSNIKINNLHQCFGHVNCKYLLDSISHGIIVAEKSDTSELKNILLNESCVDCMLGKATRSNAVKSSRSPYVIDKPFAKVYSDVSEVNAKYVKKNDHKCFIIFRCAYTGYTVVQLIKKKSEAYDKILIFVNWVYQQFTPHKILKLKNKRRTAGNIT